MVQGEPALKVCKTTISTNGWVLCYTPVIPAMYGKKDKKIMDQAAQA
jgi:hypothetical protein